MTLLPAAWGHPVPLQERSGGDLPPLQNTMESPKLHGKSRKSVLKGEEGALLAVQGRKRRATAANSGQHNHERTLGNGTSPKEKGQIVVVSKERTPASLGQCRWEKRSLGPDLKGDVLSPIPAAGADSWTGGFVEYWPS